MDKSVYAFEGNVIRLTHAGYQKWKIAYPNIPDLMGMLQRMDDYYTATDPGSTNWFIRSSNWLAKENYRFTKRYSPKEQFSNALQQLGSPILREDATLRLPKRQPP